jgi:hypothetical protein
MDEVEWRLKAKECLGCYLLVESEVHDVIEFCCQLGWET